MLLYDKKVNLIDLLIYFAVFLYVLAMFMYPLYQGSWGHLHSVLLDWQTLNAAIIAFIAAWLTFQITRYKESEHEKRELIAAKAFLPNALSELIVFYKSSAKVLENYHTILLADVERPLGDRGEVLALPEMPQEYKTAFKECIKYAEAEEGRKLAYILESLQVHNSRVHLINDYLTGTCKTIVGHDFTLVCLLRLAELYVVTIGLFNYARNATENQQHTLLESFDIAYRSLELSNYYTDLIDITKIRLLSNKSTWKLDN